MSAELIEQEILAAEEARCKATREGDLDALRELLHEDYIHVTGLGTTVNQQQYIDWIAAMPREHARHNLKVRCFGDAAMICGPLTNRIGAPEPRVVETYVTQVLHKEAGKWRFHAFQITPLT
jgi:ketosteroid isomerase-like protein